mgnify:CR=1 FL=1
MFLTNTITILNKEKEPTMLKHSGKTLLTLLFLFMAPLIGANSRRLNVTPATVSTVQELLGYDGAETVAPVIHLGVMVTNTNPSPVKALLVNWKHEVDGHLLSYSYGDEVFADRRSFIINAEETVFIAPLVIGRKSVPLPKFPEEYFSGVNLGKVTAADVDVAIFADDFIEGPNELGFVEQLVGRADAAKILLSKDGKKEAATEWGKFWLGVLNEKSTERLEKIQAPKLATRKPVATLTPVAAGGTKNKVTWMLCSVHNSWDLTGLFYYSGANQTGICKGYQWGTSGEVESQINAYCGRGSYYSSIWRYGRGWAGPGSNSIWYDCETIRANGATDCECFVPPDGRWYEATTAPFMDTGVWTEARIWIGSVCGTLEAEMRGYSTCDGSVQQVGSNPVPVPHCPNPNSGSFYGASVSHTGVR